MILSNVQAVCAATPGLVENNKANEPLIYNSEKDVIKSIIFENNRKYKDKTLLKKLDFEVGDYIDPILAESGRKIVIEFYRSKGFPHVEVMLNTKKLSEGLVIYTVVEGPRIRIKSVRFEGNKAVKTGVLKNTIKTKTRSWFFWPVYYTKEKIAADVEKLRTFYYNKGFLNHRISIDENPAHITFIIEEGPLYKLRNVTLSGNTRFDNETLLAEFKLESGQTYYPQKTQLYTRRILKFYREDGYVDADVRQRLRFVPEANVVDLEYEVTEGKKFRIGKIEITGNEQVHDKVIRRILDEYDFSPGELYNADIAPKQGGGQLERYVQMMTMSEEAMIRPAQPAEGTPDRMDALVDVKEGLTGM